MDLNLESILVHADKNWKEGIRSSNQAEREFKLGIAANLLQRLISVDSKHSLALNNLGGVFDALGKYIEAVDVLKKAIEISPNYIHAYNGLGHAYNLLGRFDEAVDVLKRAIEIDPKRVKAIDPDSDVLYSTSYNNLGYAYNLLGRFDEAVDVLKKAIRLNSEDTSAYGHIGDSHRLLGKKKVAEEYYNKSLSLFEQKRDKTIFDYLRAIRAERGLIKIGAINQGEIEQDVLLKGIVTPSLLTRLYTFEK